MAYSFIRIDQHAADLSASASKYKALRLEALQQSPTAFSSTWEVESRFSDDVWASRLCDPVKETFVCVFEEGATTEWVAQVTLRGPISAEQFRLPSGSGQPAPADDRAEEKWQMMSLYCLPNHRGKGLAAKLCKEAFQFLVRREETKTPRVQIRIMVKAGNTGTIRLYRGLGFEDSGMCTLEEALRANGEVNLLPEGELDEKFTTRAGIMMALRLDREA